MRRALLTGASGFFGHHLLRHLFANTDWEIVIICSWQYKGLPERVKQAIGGNEEYAKRLTVITHDLISPVPEMTRKNIGQIDYILNIASNSHVHRSIEDPGAFVLGNTHLAFNMLELARQLKPSLFLQFSTDEVYGAAPKGLDHPEWSPIIPSNPYSASKACQEAVAISYWRTYGIPLVITNTMNIFGQAQDPEKYVAQLIRKIHNGETVTIHGRVGDIGSRYYLHARNAADAVLYIINNLPAKLYKEDEVVLPDRYNIVGDIELNNLELAQIVAEIMGKELKYELQDFHSARPGHDRRYSLSGKKLKELGWKAPQEFRQSLENSIKWTLEHPQWL